MGSLLNIVDTEVGLGGLINQSTLKFLIIDYKSAISQRHTFDAISTIQQQKRSPSGHKMGGVSGIN